MTCVTLLVLCQHILEKIVEFCSESPRNHCVGRACITLLISLFGETKGFFGKRSHEKRQFLHMQFPEKEVKNRGTSTKQCFAINL